MYLSPNHRIMADLILYNCLGPKFCDAPFGFVKNEIKKGNVFAWIFTLCSIIGFILFIWAELAVTDVEHDATANMVLFWYCFGLIILIFLMNVFRKTSRSNQTDDNNYRTVPYDNNEL